MGMWTKIGQFIPHLEVNQGILQNPVSGGCRAISVATTDNCFVVTNGSVHTLSRATGAAFVCLEGCPILVIVAGLAHWSWASPLRMEVEAIAMGIVFSRRFGRHHIKVFSDSAAMVNLLGGSGLGPPMLRQIVETVHYAALDGNRITFSKVSRQTVRGAEVFARHAMRTSSDGYMLGLHDQTIRRLIQPVRNTLMACEQNSKRSTHMVVIFIGYISSNRTTVPLTNEIDLN
ncbi:hypothetical protein QJS10_CPB11g01976 [Acorus calamus]|uniref:RNase H type-1 domain-containing protein n=1 Tax=Acorus calamus TaxID=4465 RepID=A0AAV9DUG8_ACOCL|nr:hypothetical protein QJS10_CPB11g01976 [Acorus calamus]